MEKKNGVDWSAYDAFEWADEKYLPVRGEGETMATQAVTAISKLVYKWYNDGDVFDNTHHLPGWCNDLSSYANWLYLNVPQTREILRGIKDCVHYADYEQLLWSLTSAVETEEFLADLDGKPKFESVYDSIGPFRWVELDGDEEEDEYEDEDEWYEDGDG